MNDNFKEYQINEYEAILKFMTAGKSIFTIRNEDTNRRFTYKFIQATKNKNVYWVYMLCRADNEAKDSYKFLGGFSKERGFVMSPKSQISYANSAGAKGINWYCKHILTRDISPNIKFYHLSHCGRCGKQLTDPDSIISGYGAECMRKEVNEGNTIPVKRLENHNDNYDKYKERKKEENKKPSNIITKYIQTTFNFFK